MVFGGSWGSTLALTYGEAYPSHITGFVLRGIFYPNKENIDNLWYGIGNYLPDAWQELNDFIPREEQHDLLSAYYKRLVNSNLDISTKAANVFMKYDITATFSSITPEQLEKLLSNQSMVLGTAKIFAYYAKNNFFLKEGEIFRNLHRITHLPLFIVHGRFDLICLPKQAYILHKMWKN